MRFFTKCFIFYFFWSVYTVRLEYYYLLKEEHFPKDPIFCSKESNVVFQLLVLLLIFLFLSYSFATSFRYAAIPFDLAPLCAKRQQLYVPGIFLYSAPSPSFSWLLSFFFLASALLFCYQRCYYYYKSICVFFFCFFFLQYLLFFIYFILRVSEARDVPFIGSSLSVSFVFISFSLFFHSHSDPYFR